MSEIKLYTKDKKEWPVIKDGKIYYTVKLGGETYKVSKEDLMYRNERYSQNNKQFYSSLQAIEDEEKYNDAISKIKKFMSDMHYRNNKMTLDQAEQIVKILNL